MKYLPRMNKYEKREMHAEKLKNAMSGTGIYIYENNTDGDLKLPKATDSGIRTIGPRKRFQGDSYYMSCVGNPMNLLRLVETVVPKMTSQQLREIQEKNMADKLILDQPDTITFEGKVEHVAAPALTPQPLPLNDAADPTLKANPVLLTEDPLDGVEIILG